MQALRLAVLVGVLGPLTFLLMPLQILATRRNWRLAATLPWIWQRVARRMIGLRVTVVGTPAKPPLLIAANHVSWLDITTLGSVLPVSFIAKAEVAGWPVLGTLARLQRTVFIDRTRRVETGRATAAIARRVSEGDVMVLRGHDGGRYAHPAVPELAHRRRRRGVGGKGRHRPTRRHRLYPHPGDPHRLRRPDALCLVRRHGFRAAFPDRRHARRDRCGGRLRNPDRPRPRPRPQAGRGSMLRRGPADDRGGDRAGVVGPPSGSRILSAGKRR